LPQSRLSFGLSYFIFAMSLGLTAANRLQSKRTKLSKPAITAA